MKVDYSVNSCLISVMRLDYKKLLALITLISVEFTKCDFHTNSHFYTRGLSKIKSTINVF